MNPLPRFHSPADYVARLGDPGTWHPIVAAVLARHGLEEAAGEITPGTNPTYPTFMAGTVVVKLFGGFPGWRESARAERAALDQVRGEPGIGAPDLLAHGVVTPGSDEPWPYLILRRLDGTTVRDAGLSPDQWRRLAADLGDRVKRLHRLPPPARELTGWQPVPMAQAAARTSLPAHLAAQAAAFVARYPPDHPVFVHQDIVANHLFVTAGRLSGIIDWGDAMVADRHTELIQIHRDVFGCDKDLLRVFLRASDWPVTPDFARRALAFGLRRQAVGLAQHHSIDVFQPIAATYPLDGIDTLDALADLVFGL